MQMTIIHRRYIKKEKKKPGSSHSTYSSKLLLQVMWLNKFKSIILGIIFHISKKEMSFVMLLFVFV